MGTPGPGWYIERIEAAAPSSIRRSGPASKAESWFYDPVGDRAKKAGSHRRASRVVLHRHHAGFRIERASELRKRRVSANSRGSLEANRTSWGVPNSITVLSLKAFAFSRHPGHCTGIAHRESPRERISPAWPCAFLGRSVARAAPCLSTAYLDFPRNSRSWAPESPPVSVTWEASPDRIAR